MKLKLFNQPVYHALTRQLPQEEPANPGYFTCLGGKDVIAAKISDHHPIIHHGVLFWNIMMQGNRRRDGRPNNGFGFIENDKQYINRLVTIAHVIAEIIYLNPSIEIIGLCEGPVKELHLNAFLEPLKKLDSMKRFFETKNMLYGPNLKRYQPWGLLMFADEKYTVNTVNLGFTEQQMPLVLHNLANRFHLWALTANSETKYFALGHFPFGGSKDAEVTTKEDLSKMAIKYSQFINKLNHQYANTHFILCADFNFNPYLISQPQERALDQITNNNSILLMIDGKSGKESTKTVTVDGILLSQQAKQKYGNSKLNYGLFSHLKREADLFPLNRKEQLIQNEHKDKQLIRM